MKHYESVEFCQFLECQDLPHSTNAKPPSRNTEPPIEIFLATVLSPTALRSQRPSMRPYGSGPRAKLIARPCSMQIHYFKKTCNVI